MFYNHEYNKKILNSFISLLMNFKYNKQIHVASDETAAFYLGLCYLPIGPKIGHQVNMSETNVRIHALSHVCNHSNCKCVLGFYVLLTATVIRVRDLGLKFHRMI